MSGSPLIIWDWTDDGVMKPVGRFSEIADKHFVVGEKYRMETVFARSRTSHNHLFAEIDECWANLPPVHSGRWRTTEHLRKWVLIRVGHHKETSWVLKTHAEALRFAVCLSAIDEYAEAAVEGNVLVHRVAKSISGHEVPDRREFQRIKEAVLDMLANLIGVEPKELRANAGRAA